MCSRVLDPENGGACWAIIYVQDFTNLCMVFIQEMKFGGLILVT